MGTITNEQYESLKNKMKAICDSAMKLKKIQGAYEFSENKKQFDELSNMLNQSCDIENLRYVERDLADFIEVRFNSHLDNPKSEIDDEVANLMSEYLEESISYTAAAL